MGTKVSTYGCIFILYTRLLWRNNFRIRKFIDVYKNHADLDYAYYLLQLVIMNKSWMKKKTYNQSKIQKNFRNFSKKFPDTEYSIDAEFKLDLINDILASKEMYIRRYYLDKKKWIAAINRFRSVVDDFDTTIYTEEALYRLVEIYYIIGLKNEAQKYAKVLGYNYQSSKWYEKSYSFLIKSMKKTEKFD